MEEPTVEIHIITQCLQSKREREKNCKWQFHAPALVLRLEKIELKAKCVVYLPHRCQPNFFSQWQFH